MPVMDASVALWMVWCFALGAALGSFATATGERLARGESLWTRSHCSCGRALRPGENIPFVGWLRVRGRARCCGARLPVSLLAGEALPALAGAAGALSGVTVGVAAAVTVAAMVAAARYVQCRR